MRPAQSSLVAVHEQHSCGAQKSLGVFGYAIAMLAIDRAVDQKVGILARWRDGRCAAAAGNPDSGIADAARMVPGSLCRYRRSAPDLHGTSRTGREESQFFEHAEGRERSGRHAFGASRRTRKRRFRKNREPQDSRCSRRQQPGARRSGYAGTERACAQGSTRGDRSFVETRSSHAKNSVGNKKQRIPVTQVTNQASFVPHSTRPLAGGCPFGRSELNVVEAGHDGRLTVKKWRPSASCSPSSTSTLAHIGNRDFSGRSDVWPELCSCSCTSGATALRPNETAEETPR